MGAKVEQRNVWVSETVGDRVELACTEINSWRRGAIVYLGENVSGYGHATDVEACLWVQKMARKAKWLEQREGGYNK